jgi:membrane-bound lytic murein transglycosylase A
VAALRAVSFAELPGWTRTEAEALLAGLVRHLAPPIRDRPHEAPWLPRIARLLGIEPSDGDGWARLPLPRGDALATVERLFVPHRIEADGFLTGYYEPVITASRDPVPPFTTPLYRRPDDLVRTPPRADLPGDGTFARALPDGTLVPYFDRAEIAAGALAGRGLELAYVSDPVDAFFAQVQGSARLRFPDGTEVRIGYHGKTGHPYTAIGRTMIDRGLLPDGGATMQTIRAALAAAPELVPSVLNSNRSFVFFRERPSLGADLGPVAAAGLPLVPWRSLAVDRAHIRLGTPVHVETTVPRHGPHTGVMIAEDTGSAIVGPARGDVFFGSGPEAGEISGEMKAAARLTLFLPRG